MSLFGGSLVDTPLVFDLLQIVFLIVMQEDGACIWLARMFWSVQSPRPIRSPALQALTLHFWCHCDGEFDLQF